jgi:hypothetical protein
MRSRMIGETSYFRLGLSRNMSLAGPLRMGERPNMFARFLII